MDCSFYGSGNNAKGLLAVDGIKAGVGGSAANKHLLIRNNIFMGLPGIAISVIKSSGVMVLGNYIALDASTNGAGITLDATCTGCFVAWNDCNFGSADVSPATNSGYRDLASADANTWSSN